MSFFRTERPMQETYDQGVDLVSLIHDEFGTRPETIRNQILNGEVQVAGSKYEPAGPASKKLFVPVGLADGREIRVIGPEREWRLTYRHPIV